MDNQILLRYADVSRQVDYCRKRIERLKEEVAELENSTVTDSVSCGKKGKKPIRTVRIEGVPLGLINEKVQILRLECERLQARELALLELQNKAEKYLEDIENDEVRRIMQMRHIDKLPWYRIALQMNDEFPDRRVAFTEDSCRMRHDRFFEKE